MRKLVMLTLAVIVMTAMAGFAQERRFDVYVDKNSSSNHFIPSGWMGDIGDLRFNDQALDNPASGATSIKITYTGKKTGGKGWAGIYWQSAEHNWGAQDTGFDLSDFNKLVFKMRGGAGGEVVTKVKIGGIIINSSTGEPQPFADTTDAEYGPIKLTDQWEEYAINLVDHDLSYINGGLAIIFDANHVSGEQVVYINDIYYGYDPDLKDTGSGENFPFYVYADSNSLDNHFIPSGWMPGAPTAKDLKMEINSTENPYSGDSAIKVEYKDVSGVRWAGVYWQNPANNWGGIPNAGFDLTGATKLSFWVKGEKGGEVVNEFKMGGIAGGEYIDSDSASIGPVRLTKQWQKYEIDLRGKDLSYIVGGFCWATNIDVNDPEGITFYLDEIKYEK